MLPKARLAEGTNASSRAFHVIVFLGPIVALAAVVWAMRPERVARRAPPVQAAADEAAVAPDLRGPRLAAIAVEPDLPSLPLSPPPDEGAEPPPAPEAALSPPAQAAIAPPAPKRVDVSAAALAAERSRIALAALGPHQARLVNSGEPPAGPVPAWHSSVSTLRRELVTSLIANAGVRISDQTCFRGGCQLSIDTFDEAASVQARGRLKMLLRGEMPNPFPGETFVSGPVQRPDGYLRMTVILYAPEETTNP
jgi:hypothetical protein